MQLFGKNEGGTVTPRVIDYDIHDIVGVRVIDATREDATAVSDQLGKSQRPLTREPDIILRFREKLHTPSLTYLGLDYCGFTDEGFYVLNRRENAKIRIPFESIGSQCEVLCQTGLESVPWLSDIINFTFLTKGYVPVHASAFLYDGVGILVTGWTKGGKTEALLSFANKGAEYVGDEWVILSSDGKEMFGTAVPICVWEWYLKDIGYLVPKISIQKKALFKMIHLLDGISMLVRSGRLRKTFGAELLAKGVPVLKRQLNIRLPPDRMFANGSCRSARPDKVILSLSHSDEHTVVKQCDPSEIATQIVYSNVHEQMGFLALYKAFKYAFPNLRNEYLENAEAIQLSLLYSAIKNKDTYKVLHPYPVPLEEYFNQLRPFCASGIRVPL